MNSGAGGSASLNNTPLCNTRNFDNGELKLTILV